MEEPLNHSVCMVVQVHLLIWIQ